MTTETTFQSLQLAAPLKRALGDLDYNTPSPIQSAAIPALLEGRDLLGAAQTGTGKTAAFALPILHHLHENPKRPQSGTARALVLTPTRELAVQVAASFRSYGRHTRTQVALVYGGVGAGPQIQAMRRGVDILVATPGRLLDLHNQGHIKFSGTEFFVLDEADRMLDMGFLPDIRKVIEKLPRERQSLFFSATLSAEITRLAAGILTDPVEVRIAPKSATAEKVDHRICFVGSGDRLGLLETLLAGGDSLPALPITLVFTRTKHGADRLAKHLGRSDVRAATIHGNKSQNQRQRALEQFRSGRVQVLVATDVAARGIDVKGVDLVVNFDLPNEPEAYVHRIGRTARAGASGRALSFCTEDNYAELNAIERLLKAEIPVLSGHPYHCERTASRRGGQPRTSKGPRAGNGGRSRQSQRRRPGGFRGQRRGKAGAR